MFKLTTLAAAAYAVQISRSLTGKAVNEEKTWQDYLNTKKSVDRIEKQYL